MTRIRKGISALSTPPLFSLLPLLPPFNTLSLPSAMARATKTGTYTPYSAISSRRSYLIYTANRNDHQGCYQGRQRQDIQSPNQGKERKVWYAISLAFCLFQTRLTLFSLDEPKTKRAPTAYNLFVKSKMAQWKLDNPDKKHKEAMAEYVMFSMFI